MLTQSQLFHEFINEEEELRKKKNMTLTEIGKYLNRTSHSTIINLINFYEQKLVDNVDISNIVNMVDISNI